MWTIDPLSSGLLGIIVYQFIALSKKVRKLEEMTKTHEEIISYLTLDKDGDYRL
jgi:hypothetical protein